MGEITRLLRAVKDDDPRTQDALLMAVYADLRKLAAARLRRVAPGQTLQATELVHEAYLRLLDRDRAADGQASGGVFESRRHYFFAASRAIHDIIVERARRKLARKRGGDLGRVSMTLVSRLSVVGDQDDGTRALEISDTMERLRAIAPEQADVVLLRYFGGLSCEEVADILDVSLKTVNRRWNFARAWLAVELRED